MQLLNRPINLFLCATLLLFLSCGDHSKPEVISNSGATPIINITSGPYVVVVKQEIIVGIETQFANNEPVYTALPTPTGIAQVNDIRTGQIVISGFKAGTTTFTITDQANPTAIPRTIEVTVNEPPKLEITPNPIDGLIGQSILLGIATIDPENEAKYELTISDLSVARILDPQSNPHLIDFVKTGTTTVTVKDVNNSLSEDIVITVQ